MASRTAHSVTTQTYAARADTVQHPLTAYLLRLMTIKQSNLCLSADVSTANQLLSLANSIGPSIVVLKTHYDLVSNWDYSPASGTGAKLQKLARKHGFLIFEDRKFGDIGNTVQLQYTEGSARIIEWSHITNVNMVPGKAVVDSMADAAKRWRERKRYEVKTDITAGTRRALSMDSGTGGEDDDDEDENHDKDEHMTNGLEAYHASSVGRKASIVSITTVSQHFEPANSPRALSEDDEDYFTGIEDPPLERGLLILAQMSSAGNFMSAEYTSACVEAAREHPNYVMGFIAQETLNREPADHFLTMTPGCQLPPEEEGEEAKVEGDGKGQQYNTPRKLVLGQGCDMAIVGRGIIKAANPRAEAERYRRAAWGAYMERVGS